MSVSKFFKDFLVSPNVTGAVMPSSRGLANLIVQTADLGKTSVLLEFGTGTGVFTEKILESKPEDCRLIAFEINPEFARITRERCPGVDIRGDVAEARHQLNLDGLDECDVIISGLPWAIFSDELQNSLLDATLSVLKPGGKFLTFTYVSSFWLPAGKKFKKKLDTNFSAVGKTKVVWKNVPPAFVYHCEK